MGFTLGSFKEHKSNFEAVASAPSKVEAGLAKIESVPFFGNIFKGIVDVIPGGSQARDIIREASDVENFIKDKLNIDLEQIGRDIDDRFYTGQSDRYGQNDSVRTPPVHVADVGATAPHFNHNSFIAYAGSNSNNVATQ